MALTDNITAYYKLDEASGNAADSVGSATLTNNGTVTYGAALINNGALFTASTTWLSNASNIAGTSDVSYSFWVKSASEISANFYTFLWFNRGATGYEYVRYAYNAGTFRIDASNSDVAAIHYNTTLGTTNWHHIVWTRLASTGAEVLYLDGSQVATATENTPFNNGSSAFVGQPDGGSSGNFFNGRMDEVGVWARVLTSGEVTSLYNAGAGLQYPFSGGGATLSAKRALQGVGL